MGVACAELPHFDRSLRTAWFEKEDLIKNYIIIIIIINYIIIIIIIINYKLSL